MWIDKWTNERMKEWKIYWWIGVLNDEIVKQTDDQINKLKNKQANW